MLSTIVNLWLQCIGTLYIICIMSNWTKIDINDESTWPKEGQAVYWAESTNRFGSLNTFRTWGKYRWFKEVGRIPCFHGSARGDTKGYWRPCNDNDYPVIEE